MDTSKDQPTLLGLIIDSNPFKLNRLGIPTKELFSHILVFVNSFLALRPENRLTIIGASSELCQYFIPEEFNTLDNNKTWIDIEHSQIRKVDIDFLSGLQTLFEKSSIDNIQNKDTCKITNALSRALCYINKNLKSTSKNDMHSRIMIISASDDDPKQYIPIMNCIFAAQKLDIIIDVCRISEQRSPFLEQAAEITGGRYAEEIIPSQLLQKLLFTFLPDQYTRQFIQAPIKKEIDFRAVCFCHKKVVDIGYVCSTCLSIFCHYVPICSTCQSKFVVTAQKGNETDAYPPKLPEKVM
ncbi:hypothetical protein BB561_002054 [Smittium simulii]|uniref:General transcription and DNA repair factor IIH subunit TFB4 n=1 Tax=Smittium simulii TaxID=133385 RepID=A0A2T9YS06_9FUNG|nr:hypothetical protein BB561_002054 [Smittium simulii]